MNFLNWIKKHFYILIITFEIVIIFLIIFTKNNTNENKYENAEISTIMPSEEQNNKEENEEQVKMVKIDIKGAVKKPGVYEVSSESIINDVITKAGGLKTGATTKNINLSKKVSNEMVIIISTQADLEKKDNEVIVEPVCKENTIIIEKCENSSIIESSNETNSSNNNPNSENQNNNNSSSSENDENKVSSKISINNASKEELMKITGIGEAKALSIIEYREKNGGFKTIEDITKVSGIGEALFEKIKNDITI